MPCPNITQFCFRKRIAQVSLAEPMPVTNALVTLIVFGVNTLTLTLDRAVALEGFPNSWVVRGGAADGESPVSAVLLSPTSLELTFVGVTTLSTALELTPYDPAVRTPDGGFCSADAFRN